MFSTKRRKINRTSQIYLLRFQFQDDSVLGLALVFVYRC